MKHVSDQLTKYVSRTLCQEAQDVRSLSLSLSLSVARSLARSFPRSLAHSLSHKYPLSLAFRRELKRSLKFISQIYFLRFDPSPFPKG